MKNIIFKSKERIVLMKMLDNKGVYQRVDVENEAALGDLLEKELTEHPDASVEYFFADNEKKNAVALENVLTIKEKGRYYPRNQENIKVIVGAGSSSHIIYADNSKTTVCCNLAAMEKILSPNYFVRIHKSYIVNVRHIAYFVKGRVFLGDEDYPIGREYKRSFIEAMRSLVDPDVFCRENKSRCKIKEE